MTGEASNFEVEYSSTRTQCAVKAEAPPVFAALLI